MPENIAKVREAMVCLVALVGLKNGGTVTVNSERYCHVLQTFLHPHTTAETPFKRKKLLSSKVVQHTLPESP